MVTTPEHKPKRRVRRHRPSLHVDRRYAETLAECVRVFPDLTPAEQTVCALVVHRLKNWEIAEATHVKEHTIENYRRSICKHFDLSGNGRNALYRFLTERIPISS